MIISSVKRDALLLGLIFVFACTIPLSQFISTRLLIMLLLFSFFVKHDWITVILDSWNVVLFLLVLLLGLLYSEDITTGLRVLETSFSLFAIPIIFSSLSDFNEKKMNNVTYFFGAGLIAASTICLLNATLNYLQEGDTSSFFFYSLTNIIRLQPVYFAYCLIFAITFGIYLLYYQKSLLNPRLLITIIFYFFLTLMLTGGQTAFISLLFVFSFFILKILVEERNSIRWTIFGMIGIMIVSMFLISLLERGDRDFILNDSWERFALWEAAIRAIPNIVWGVGTGDYKMVMNQYYLTHGLGQFAKENFNSHNQFIQIILANGIPGLLALLFLIFRPLYLAVKSQHSLGVLVFFPFLIYGMTEVFFGRYQGVVFFSLLHQMFISYYSSLKPSLETVKLKKNY